jgi:hypothetical protein
VTVNTAQIEAAKKAGLTNVEALARACDNYAFPFYLACVIMDMETNGANIFGHDLGGVFYVKPPEVVQVTEERYHEFKRRIDAGEKSNGVGPFQITWKPYFPRMEQEGLKPWLAADNIKFGVSILRTSFNNQLDQGKSVKEAFRGVAKAYNGKDSYATTAVGLMPTWLARVGEADKPYLQPVPPGVLPEIKQVTAEILSAVARQGFQILTVYGITDHADHNNRRCVDYMINSPGLGIPAGDAIAKYVIANADRLRVNWMIWNHRIWRRVANDKGPAGWSEYTGTSDPHINHVHLECAAGTYRPPIVPPPDPPDPEPIPDPPEDDMELSPEQIEQIADASSDATLKKLLNKPYITAFAKNFLEADVVPAPAYEPVKTNTRWTLMSVFKQLLKKAGPLS